MEYLTVKIDCTETHCGECTMPDSEFGFCHVFGKELDWDGDYRRLSECIEACKAQKKE